jgi:hypothetical protein
MGGVIHPGNWCSKQRAWASRSPQDRGARFHDARDARRSHRSDRPNGTGKTTALRLPLERSSPTAASASANVQIATMSAGQLDPERTVFDTVGDGNDTVIVNGQPRTWGTERLFLLPDGPIAGEGTVGRRTQQIADRGC